MHISFSKNAIAQNPLVIGEAQLLCVEKAKILGITVQNNLKWDSHVSDLIIRSNKKLYMLRCLKTYKLPLCDLITVFKGYVRPILDYGVPIFNGNLTNGQILSLERIQKRACRIMLGDQYINYDNALELCSLQRLDQRRKQLCLDFATSLINHPMCSEWLPVKHDVGYSCWQTQGLKRLLTDFCS